MVLYILQKIGYALLTLVGVVTVIFLLFNILPGDPARMMLGQNETAEQVAIVKKKYGFDKSLGTQYLLYLNDLSPLSFHSKSEADYSFLKEGKYHYTSLFSTAMTIGVKAKKSIINDNQSRSTGSTNKRDNNQCYP